MPVNNLSDILVANLKNTGARPSADLDDLAKTVVDRALDPGKSVADIVALARKAGVTVDELNRVSEKVMNGTGDWKDTGINTRGRLAQVLSRVLEGLEHIEPMRPNPVHQKGHITLEPGKTIDDLSAQDRKYVEAFEKAGIKAGLAGERGSINAEAMTKMLDIAGKGHGLSLKEFVGKVIPDSPDLGFFGVTTSRNDCAAAVLLAGADRLRADALKHGDVVTVDKLDELGSALLDKKNRTKEEISTVYNALDRIFMDDPKAAAKGLRTQLLDENIGRTLRGRYDFHLNFDGSKMIVDPYIEEQPVMRGRAMSRSAVVSQKSALGGRELQLVDDKFKSGKWEQHSLADLANGNQRFLDTMLRNKFDLNAPRDVLVVRGENDDHPIYLVFSKTGDGVLTVCQDCAFHQFDDGAGGGGGGGGPIMVRKPVIYLYPTRTQPVTVSLEVQGEMLVEYPGRNRGNSWELIASPSGELFEPKQEKRYSYLFWEAERTTRFEIDLAKSYRVERNDVASFLEKVANAYALTDRERTDFVSYWIAPMRANGTSIVQLANDVEYTKYAKLSVSPTPDTMIRLFMIFRRARGEEQVGSPELIRRERRGFTVLEWGGSNLDEITEVRR